MDVRSCVDPVDEVADSLARTLRIQQHNSNQQMGGFSLPSASSLVSAMKGGRGGSSSGRKLRVSWAEDVYDPIPTLVSHTVTKKQNKSKQNKKKNSKKAHKGNSSRSKDKDKKHCRSSNRASSAMKHSDDFDDGVTILPASSDSASYCGSSFLKESLSNMHYPVAEAL